MSKLHLQEHAGANWMNLSRAPGWAERSARGAALTHHGRDTERKRKNQV